MNSKSKQRRSSRAQSPGASRDEPRSQRPSRPVEPNDTAPGDGHDRPTIFISHRSEDKEAAAVVASRLKVLSERIEVFLASDPRYEGPRIGKSINQSLLKALGDTSLVLLLFTSEEHDWAYCMWECGVATDPKDATPTNVVTLALRGEAPRVYIDALSVNARDRASVYSFVKQLCTEKGFFPNTSGALSAGRDDQFLHEQADSLFKALSPFTSKPQLVTEWRWGGFTVTLDPQVTRELGALKARPMGTDLQEILSAAHVTTPKGNGLSHFGYINVHDGLTLMMLRERWEERRDERPRPERVKNMPWSEVIGEELWRIVTFRETNLTWEPFLSLREGASDLWVYPVVYQFRHSDEGYAFDLLIVQTRAPSAPPDSGYPPADPRVSGPAERRPEVLMGMSDGR